MAKWMFLRNTQLEQKSKTFLCCIKYSTIWYSEIYSYEHKETTCFKMSNSWCLKRSFFTFNLSESVILLSATLDQVSPRTKCYLKAQEKTRTDS